VLGHIIITDTYGLFDCRLGIAFAQPPLIQILTNTKAPYNVSAPSAHLALMALSPDSIKGMKAKISTILNSRIDLLSRLSKLPLGPVIGANHANFILVRVMDKDEGKRPDRSRAQKVYKMMAEEEGVVVRYRGSEVGCEGCLRITVGSQTENDMVIRKLREVLARV
jgi:histidinol-phosphate aminotransferase